MSFAETNFKYLRGDPEDNVALVDYVENNAGSGGGTTTNTLYVDVGGNDATGERNKPNKPFLTCLAAQTAASVGDTIVVRPGSYSGNSLGGKSCNWHWMPGTTYTSSQIVWNCAGTNVNIDGHGIFISTGASTSGVTVNSTGSLYAQCKKIQAQNAGVDLIGNAHINAEEIFSVTYDGIIIRPSNSAAVHIVKAGQVNVASDAVAFEGSATTTVPGYVEIDSLTSVGNMVVEESSAPTRATVIIHSSVQPADQEALLTTAHSTSDITLIVGRYESTLPPAYGSIATTSRLIVLDRLRKEDVGLGNVDNTSDANKPISTATQTALNDKQNYDAGLASLAALASTGFVYVVSGNTFSTRTNVVTTFSDLTNGVNRLSVIWNGGATDHASLAFTSQNDDQGWPLAEVYVNSEEVAQLKHGNAYIIAQHDTYARLECNGYALEATQTGFYVSHPEQFRNAIEMGASDSVYFDVVHCQSLNLRDTEADDWAGLRSFDERLLYRNPYTGIETDVVFRTGTTFTGDIAFSNTTVAGLRANNLSNAQIVALVSPQNGSFVYDTDIHRFQGRCNGAWRSIVDTSGGQTIAGTTTFGSGSGSIVVRQSTNFGIIENSTTSGGVIIKSSGTSAGCYYDASFHNFRNGAGSTNLWSISSAGNFQPGTTNTSDIGTTSVRPRDAWLSRNLDVAGTTFLGRFIFSALPSASANTDGLVVCTDRTNRPLAKSDGTNWRNVFDGTILI